MDQRTKLFLAGANLAANWLFKSLGLEPRVLRIAVPSPNLPTEQKPIVEHLPEFTPEPCWDGTLIDELHRLSPRDTSSRSTDISREWILASIAKCEGAGQFVHFCSFPQTVDGYQVCILLQLDKSAYYSIPRLVDSPHPYDHPVQFSLVDHAIHVYLSECFGELSNPDPNPLRGWKHHEEILRSAGWAMAARAVAVIKNGPMVSELFFTCVELASSQYERRDSLGSIVVSAREHPNVEPVVLLLEPEPMTITALRTSRKLLQLCTAGLSLLFDGDGIYGAGNITPGYDVHSKNLFTIEFTKPSTWELRHYGTPLMVVSHGNPRLPTPNFPDLAVRQQMIRLFGPLDEPSLAKVCDLTRAACAEKHGTTFIISSGASREAERLQHQCFRLSPVVLSPTLLPSLTDIDGAVLVDTDGACHAIGVILDGRVNPQGLPLGNRGRGARYNSAVRYASDENCPKCLIIVRSEDGMLDLIPGGETKSVAKE